MLSTWLSDKCQLSFPQTGLNPYLFIIELTLKIFPVLRIEIKILSVGNKRVEGVALHGGLHTGVEGADFNPLAL